LKIVVGSNGKETKREACEQTRLGMRAADIPSWAYWR